MGTETKIKALAKHLDVEPSEVDAAGYGNNIGGDNYFEVQGEEWLVLTDDEADDAARVYILDSVWAFRPEFLAARAVDGVDADHIRAIQDNGKCESNNALLLRLIGDVDHFVDDAIKADGRGHFLASYDSEEVGLRLADGSFLFAYRVN